MLHVNLQRYINSEDESVGYFFLAGEGAWGMLWRKDLSVKIGLWSMKMLHFIVIPVDGNPTANW